MSNISTSQPSRRVAGRAFTGPHGAIARHSAWTSGFLELHEDGSFILELWRLYESWGQWRVTDDEIGTTEFQSNGSRQETQTVEFQSDGSRKEIQKETTNTQVHYLDETRLKYSGTFTARKAQGLKLNCLKHPGLNQLFIEDTSKVIGGKPSWWSTDGQFFLYYAEQYAHWKVNGLRVVGGDGVLAVQPGRRKAGHGFAHSGPGDSFESLCRPDGWFEDVDNVWTPVEVEVAPSEAVALEFHASEVSAADKEVRGDEVIQENFVGGSVTFRGSCGSSVSGDVRLMLPPAPERLQEGRIEAAPEPSNASSTAAPDREGGVMGDPDVFLMRQSARL